MQQASGTDRPDNGAEIDALADRVEAMGRRIGLPFVAASADIGSPEPMRDSLGRPFAETVFRWIDPELRYWEDHGFALRAVFIHAARVCSEPFHFHHGKLATWRPSAALDAINQQGIAEDFGVGAAIVAPAYLPGGVIGGVVWASPDQEFDVAKAFDRHAPALHALAMRFVAAARDHSARQALLPPVQLTRREIQCLKWGAAGKTDAEIGAIMNIAVPTVRFHMTNAARKLGVAGRSQAIYRAATLGYVGAGPAARS